jgi:glycosyltransferase involved in cell wall biosynthesis
MNICFVTVGEIINPLAAGVDRVVYNLMPEFQTLGHNVIGVYCIASEDKTDLDFKQFRLPDCSDIQHPSNIKFLHQLLVDYKIDIILNESFYYSMFDLSLLAKKGTRAKIVSTLHTVPDAVLKELRDKYDYIGFKDTAKFAIRIQQLLFILKYPLSYFLRYKYIASRHKRMYAESDAYVLLSDRFFKKFKSIAGIKESPGLFAITNPIILEENKILPKKKQIVFVGRMVYQKRADRVLNIWRKLYEKYPDWQLIMIGDGSDFDAVKQYAHKLQLKNVFFTGQINPQKWYQESKVLCMTSTYEGFGVVLIEALSYGCVPIAYASYESIHDIIADDLNGCLVEPFKKKAFIRKLEKLMADEEYLTRLSNEAVKSVQKFDVKLIAPQWIDLFTQILS